MVELTLVRHAKSDWSDPTIADHDRPLNPRGTRDAPIMARRARARLDADPGARGVERLVSSTATRARTTAATFGSALGVEVELDPELYLASASQLLDHAIAAGSGRATVMLVAHNPGLSDLAAVLSQGEITHLPTCAVARFTWADPSWHTALTRPADSWHLDTPR